VGSVTSNGSSRVYPRAGKRLLDLGLILIAAPLLLPVALLLALMVHLGLGRPVLFSQRRPGKDGVTFRMFKFRTMTEERDDGGVRLPDDERLTVFGRWLRGSSLDEIPELWNVLKGQMSLVGPRPLLTEYLELYDTRQARRHEVKPGITGWAQVNGRNAVSWEEKLELDVWYVERTSLRLDLRILAKTLLVVASGGGVSAEGHSTMPRFTGSEREDP